MIINNTFDVPLEPNDAWALLLDVEKIVSCAPGCELVERVDDSAFKGIVKVKIGPVAVELAGLAELEIVDAEGHTARIKAKGADRKGRGNANAVSTFEVHDVEGGSNIRIATDLSLSGMIAQYGRASGMLQAIAQQIVNDFAANLRALIEREPGNSASGPDDTAVTRKAASVSVLRTVGKAALAKWKGP